MTAPGHRAAAQGDPRARRPRGGRRSAPHRDRRRSPTEHLFIRPGHRRAAAARDAARRSSPRSWSRRARSPRSRDGLDRLRDGGAPFTPERVAARDRRRRGRHPRRSRATFAAAPRAVVLRPRRRVARRSSAGSPRWLINALNIVTGNLDAPGGAMFTTPGGRPRAARGAHRPARATSRGGGAACAGCPSSAASCRSRRSPRRSTRRAPGQIRALVTLAGNPVLSTPNGARLERALAQLEFMVSIDIYLNETTRHAHLILPPTVGARARPLRPRASTRSRCATPPSTRRRCSSAGPDARHDWEIFLELATRHRRRAAARDASRRAPRVECGCTCAPRIRRCVDLRPARFGPCRGVAREALEARPHGIDLGPLAPCLPRRLLHARPARSTSRPRGLRRRSRTRCAARSTSAGGDGGGLRADRPARPAQQQLVDAQQRRGW